MRENGKKPPGGNVEPPGGQDSERLCFELRPFRSGQNGRAMMAGMSTGTDRERMTPEAKE